MIALALTELAEIVGGTLMPPAGAGEYADTPALADGALVETDSRRIRAGDCFFAMRGEHADGADFAQAAIDAGAAVVVAERELMLPVPVIVVADGVQALQSLAREVVARVRAEGALRVIGVTGSNGKTTTKNLLGAILSAQGPTVAPRESFNNHVGAPVSMLRVAAHTRFLVVEMGAGKPGDITRLVDIVVPDVSIVLKVGLAHVGEFGGPEATAVEKAEIVTRLPASAVALLNRDDTRVAAMAEKTAAEVRWFGLGQGADLRADDVRTASSGTSFTLVTEGERLPVHLRILGEHHVMNALAALGAAHAVGVPYPEAIEALGGVERAERWRMEALEPGDGITVINDAYNASPDSMAAALKTLAQLSRDEGRRSVAVLGEMAELGDYAQDEHDRIGRLAVRLDIRRLIVVGQRARHIHNAAGLEGSWDGESSLVPDPDAALALLREELRPGDLVLVKSSKSAELRFLGDRIGGVTT